MSYKGEMKLVIRMSGRAREIFPLLALKAQLEGNKTLKKIITEEGTREKRR